MEPCPLVRKNKSPSLFHVSSFTLVEDGEKEGEEGYGVDEIDEFFFLFFHFLFRCVRISIRELVRWSVRPSVGRSVMLSSKSMKSELLRILTDLNSADGGKE